MSSGVLFPTSANSDAVSLFQAILHSGVPNAVLSFALVATLIGVVVWQIKSRWITAGANEWLILVENGQLVKSGIGLTVFKGLNSVVVRFPSFIQKVGFSAEQITKEVQGVKVTGFVVWSIFRDGEGPLKAYRYLDGLSASGVEKANENLARMAESIIRHHVANATIHEVVTNRESMRDKCKKDMGEVVKGWGVWLETVEVTEVRICSGSLFEDLQVEFRQSTKRAAEKLRLETKQDIQQHELRAESEMSAKKADAATVSAIYAAKKKLEQSLEENKCQVEMRNRKAEAESSAAIFAAKCEQETKKKAAEGDNQAQIYTATLQVEVTKKKAEAQSASAIHAAAIDAETRIKKATAEKDATAHTLAVDTELRNRKLDSEVEAALYAAKRKLAQRQEEEKLAAELNRIRALELKAEHETEMLKSTYEAERARAAAVAKLEREQLAARQDLQLLRDRVAIDHEMGPSSLHRMALESTRDVYKSLPLQSVRLVNVAGTGNGSSGQSGSLESLLPSLMGLNVASQQIHQDAVDSESALVSKRK